MSKALAISIADEVVSLLNAASLTKAFGAVQFEAVRKYVPILDRANMVTVQVTVVPGGIKNFQEQGRNRWDGDYLTDVAVQIALNDPESANEVDQWSYLLEQIYLYLLDDDGNGNSRRVLSTSPQASLTGVDVLTLGDPKELKEKQCYMGVLRLNYYASTVTR